MPSFILDSNIFIEAKNRYYPFDIFPAFWDWIDAETNNGNLCSSRFVYQELARGRDELAEWVKDRQGPDMFPGPSPDAQERFGEISDFVMANYATAKAEHFLDGADPWIIAQAMDLDACVVTRESLLAANAHKVSIPNICVAFDVDWCNTFDMLRKLGARF